jgi:TusE/DsrC/DsvC family sulfur relay protein
MLTNETGIQGSITADARLFDEDGFLFDHTLWTEELAQEVAALDEIGPLTEEHWRVIHHIRDKFLKFGALPNIRLVCRATGFSREQIYALFGGCLAIWRIAGLPNPGEEAKAYLS